MDFRRIRGTDLTVSTICFGPMRSAVRDGGNFEDDKSRQGRDALSCAIDSGINFIHSSHEYGVRWMMNAVLRDHSKRHDLHHVIKIPTPNWDDKGRFDAAVFRQLVEEALTELCTDRIAMVQWMWRTKPNDDATSVAVLGDIIDEVAATFAKLRDEGKVGYLSALPYNAAASAAVIASGKIDAFVAFNNPLEMDMAALMPELDRRDMSQLAFRPLFEGVLTDSRTTWEALPDGDRLKTEEHRITFERRAAVAREFAEVIAEEGSMTRFAYRFPLYTPATASLIVGLNTPSQVEAAVASVDGVTPRPDVTARALKLWQDKFGIAGN